MVKVSKPRIVVTGASGFIGKYLTALLTKNSLIEVIPVSRTATLGGLCVESYEQTPSGEILIHLAESSNRMSYPGSMLDNESDYQATLCSLLSKGYKRVVYTSSSVLYGDGQTTPHLPSLTFKVSDTYSKIKKAGEGLVLQSTGGVVVRLGNVYGPGMGKSNVLSKILAQIPGTGPLYVQDTGPVRDFIYVSDVAQGLAQIALSNLKQAPEIYNLGTGYGTPIGKLAEIALCCVSEGHRSVISENKPSSTSCLILDNKKTTLNFGWAPEVSLRDGVNQLLEKK